MKSKLYLLVSLAIGLGVGFIAGRHFAAHSWNAFFEHYIYLRESNETQRLVRVLTYLREGKQQDGMDVLELYLDSSLLDYTPLVLRPRPEGPDAHVLRSIRIARDYRSIHPWRGMSSELSNAVQQVMSLPK